MQAEMTALDRAHAAMEAAPERDERRLAFYGELADSELFLLLREEPAGRDFAPEVFDLEEGRFALAFDTEDRLAGFGEGPVPYVALPGRVVARELAGQGVGLGLNLGVAPSSLLLPAEALGWLSQTLEASPTSAAAHVLSFAAPDGVPDSVRDALARKLAALGGVVRRAYLVSARYQDGGTGDLLAFEGAKGADEAALAKAVGEALVFSGVEAGALDVVFLTGDDPALAAMAGHALRMDIPEPAPVSPAPAAPTAPGMDPNRPPKLR